jgi:diguanylate cyclase (GGDEF)-like protein
MIWNGVRLFHGRRVLPPASFAEAMVWLVLSQDSAIAGNENARAVLDGMVVAVYTFFIAFELWRERRKSAFSLTAAIIVPMLHAAIVVVSIAMTALLPSELGARWLDLLALEAVHYSVGTAIIVMLLVKDHHVHFDRSAAETDHLTGVLIRRVFLVGARRFCAFQRTRRQPVTPRMFDLDHFKSIYDRFGHAGGDEVLRLFATSTSATLRATDMIGRLGGEEFAAIIAAPLDTTTKIAERIRLGFEAAGKVVGGHTIGVTVSIGAACLPLADDEVEALLAGADAALYRAKGAG